MESIKANIFSHYDKVESLKREVEELKENFPAPEVPLFEVWETRDWLNRFFALYNEKLLHSYLKDGLGEKKVNEAIEELRRGKAVLAPVVEKPPYQSRPFFPQVEGLSDYEAFTKGGLTEKAQVARLKAFLYASPISPKARTLGWWEEMEEVGRLLEKEIEELEKKGGTAEELERKKELFRAVKEILDWREEQFKKVKKGWEEFLSFQEKLSNPAAVEFLRKLGRVPSNPHLRLAYSGLLETVEKANQKVVALLGQITENASSEWIYDRDIDFEWLRSQFPWKIPQDRWEEYKKLWNYYRRIAQIAPKELRTSARLMGEMKRWFLRDLVVSESAFLIHSEAEKGRLAGRLSYRALKDFLAVKWKEIPEELRNDLAADLERVKKERRDFFTSEELKNIKEGLSLLYKGDKYAEEVLEIIREAEELQKSFLDGTALNAYRYPLFLPVKDYYGKEGGEELWKRFIGEVKEGRRELGEYLFNLAEEYLNLGIRFRALKNASFVDNAVRVYNLDLLKERARQGRLPIASLTDEELGAFLGVSPDSSIVKSFRLYLKEVEAKKLERTVEKYPLSSADYLRIMRDAEYIRYARKLLKKVPTTMFLSEKLHEKMAAKGRPALEVMVDGVRKALFGLGITFNHAGVSFYECLREASWPPEKWKVAPSGRIRECLEKYFQNLKASAQSWSQFALSMGDLSPVNPLKAPIALIALYAALWRSWESGYAKRNYHLFQEELRRKADRLLYLSPYEVDSRIKEAVYDITGVRFDVKNAFELTRLEREETLLEPEEIVKEALKLLKAEDFEGAREKLELLLVGTEKEKLLEKLETIPPEKLEEEIYEVVNPNDLKITVFSEDASKALVITVNAEKLRQAGEGEFLKLVKEAGQKKGRAMLLRHLGISEKYIRELLTRGELFNGMEYHQIWENVANSLAAQTIREARPAPVEIEIEEKESEIEPIT